MKEEEAGLDKDAGEYEHLIEEIRLLRLRVNKLERANKALKKENSDMGWRLYPEDMGK